MINSKTQARAQATARVPIPAPEGRPSLSRVSSGTKKLPNRALVYAPEGWGKTSFAAQAQDVIFLCTRGEDGLEKLIETEQVGETAHFEDQAKTWQEVIAAVDELIITEHDYRVFVLDTINGAQQLLFRQVCQESFGGSEKDFTAWAQGARTSLARWCELLQRLDRLREVKRMSVLLLGHAEVVKFTNPEGPDYDRWQPAIDRKYLWPEMARWLDIILFGCFETFAEKEGKASRGKAKGGQKRLLLTERSAAYDAKNRHGMPSEIDCGEDASEAWEAFLSAMKGE